MIKKDFDLPEILKTKKISFDVDGVKADTGFLAVRLYNKKFKDKKKKSELLDFHSIYDWVLYYTKNKNEAEQISKDIWNHKNVQLKAKPLGGAVDLSKFLFSNKIEVHYITSRPFNTKKVTHEWFNKWFPWVPEKLIHTVGSDTVSGSYFKANLIKDLNIDYHFDDYHKHAEEILNISPKAKVVLVRQPWNQKIPMSSFHKDLIVAKDQRNISRLKSAYLSLLHSL